MNYTGTFTKLKNGKWAIRINNAFGDLPQPGSVVLVSSKRSPPQNIQIDEVFWHDSQKGIALANYTAELLYGKFGWGEIQHVDSSFLTKEEDSE